MSPPVAAVPAGVNVVTLASDPLEHPLDGPALAIVGPAGSGKTTMLVARALRAAGEGDVWLTAADARVVEQLRERYEGSPVGAIVYRTLSDYALEIVRTLAPERGAISISDVRAAHVFEEVGARLFSLDWTEFVSAEIDPEITGLRAPERFSSAAFRLIRRLRGAQISQEEFRRRCMNGATEFYAKPPNFANPELLMGTPKKYLDSLRISPAELRRQYERELDLVKILSKLYDEYVATLVERGCLTPTDAVYEATTLLNACAAKDSSGRSGRPFISPRYAFVDEAQDLNAGEIAFLRALYGERLERVSLAGDEREATRTFAGARGTKLLQSTEAKLELDADRRGNGAIRAIAAQLLAGSSARSASGIGPPQSHSSGPGTIETFRAADPADEARYVAAKVVRLRSEGVPAHRIAVITRSLRNAYATIDALLARNVAVDVAGQASLFDFVAVQDGLAALWALADPYRHEWMLRNLEAPWLALSDASIARLCAEPADRQAPLFVVAEPLADERGGRWNPQRDLRLGRNLTRGDVDAELSPDPLERVRAFRAALGRWEVWEGTLALPELVRAIFAETVFAAAGEDDARGRFDRGLLERLLAEIDGFAEREPLASLVEFLNCAERIAEADADLLTIEGRDASTVAVLDVEAAKGREFDHLFIVEARAGAFPRYYAPDAFLFLPSGGMVPKDNVGADAGAARTAKFTYAMHRFKFQDHYVEQERRAFYSAATRARKRLYVSASERPTKGVAAPELLVELEQALQTD